MGTNQSARDMDAIRQALGEDTISYFGWSYGSELGAVWATLFPTTVRAAVLDGAADPTADSLDRSLQQAAGFEKSLNTFLADCSADEQCPFHNGGDAEGAFDTLMERIDEDPLPTEAGRPRLSRGMALTSVAQAMYSTELWPQLQSALVAADEGDGLPLLALYDQYLQRRDDGTWDDTLEAFQVISCQDMADRASVEEEDALADRYREVAPRTAPGTSGSYFCTFFPPSIDPEIPVTGKGAGPILVMGTTGDPATPLEGTRRMAETLEDGRLVVVTAEGHTGYAPGRCSGKVIEAYLIDPVGKAPADGTECR
jgi:pimeloyl-ACP methyl ester carboxylesterase